MPLCTGLWMETFDTNVIVRLLVEDDLQQSAIALRKWRTALDGGGVFLPKLVLAEAVWVLRMSYRFDRQAIAGVLGALLRTEGLTIEDEPLVLVALDAYAVGGADFSDYLILETARAASALPVHTFDRHFARHAEVLLMGHETDS